MAACVTTPAPVAAPATVAEQAAVTPKPAVKKPVKSTTPTKHVAQAPAGASAKPKPVVIVGQREEDVIALLGAPDSEVAALPAKVLRYAGTGCSLEIYMFPDMAAGGFRALDMTASGGPTETQCLDRVRASFLVQ